MEESSLTGAVMEADEGKEGLWRIPRECCELQFS